MGKVNIVLHEDLLKIILTRCQIFHLKSISVLSIGFFLLHKVLITAQPGYLRNLISVDSPFIETRSSSSVTLSRPSSSSSLKITDRSFRYAFPCLWNKLPASFRQPNPDHSFSHSSQPNCLGSFVPSHHHHFHCPSLQLFSTLNSKQRYLSLNPSRHRLPSLPSDCLYGHRTAQWFFLAFLLTF